MNSRYTSILIILLSFTIFSFKAFAAFPTDIWPQAGQTAQWTVSATNELCFDGTQPGFGPATIATTFGNLVSNDYTGLKIKFDAYISAAGESTTLVLSSNGVWGGKGILIEMNKYSIVGVSNFSYPGTMITSDVPTYQNSIVKTGMYNSFIVDVSAAGIITVTVNGYVCPTTYAAALSVLQAAAPVPRFAYFCAGFTGFKLKNLNVQKASETRQYFTPVTTLPGISYYIDAINGSDIATGTSESDAWKTFVNVNKRVLAAGTKILLKKGSVWNQRLEIRGAGTQDNWIQVDSYGSDSNKPKISLTNHKDDIALLICDLDKTSGTARSQSISYIKIQNIEISDTRMGIYYRSITGTTNTGFVVDNVTFNNINCDPVLIALNSASDKNAEITSQLLASKGNLETMTGDTNGGDREYIFPAAIFVGGKTMTNQTISGAHTTVLTEWQVSNCQFNETIAGVMSVFYWPVSNSAGSNIWRQLIHKVKIFNCTSTGIVNGILGLDCLDGGAIADANGVMGPDANGWGLIKNVNVTMGSAVPGRTFPNGTTGVIFSNCQNMLVDSCEFSDLLNQNNPDGCGFDFETHNQNVTIQNTKFINNDGHSILLMNGGNYGGNSNILIQKNLIAKNVKNSTSTTEFLFSQDSDGNSNVRVKNNQVFMRQKNKDNKNIYFIPNRSYITASNNDLYYLDDSKPDITVSFLGLPYAYKGYVSSVSAPQVSSLLLNNGASTTTSKTINVLNEYAYNMGTPSYYMVSENANFTGAEWVLYSSKFSFQLSAGDGGKIVYYKTKNAGGTSSVYSSAIQLNESLTSNKLIESSDFKIKTYPNPIQSIINVDIQNNNKVYFDSTPINVTIFSFTGHIIQQQTFKSYQFSIDTSSFPSGVLYLKIENDQIHTTKKIIKL